MIKRPRRDETEEDLLRMQQEFLEQKSKNPQLCPAAQIVKVEKGKKSLFARQRQQDTNNKIPSLVSPTTTEIKSAEENQNRPLVSSDDHIEQTHSLTQKDKEELCEFPTASSSTLIETNKESNVTSVILGDIIERSYEGPKILECDSVQQVAFPQIDATPITFKPQPGKSIFACAMISTASNENKNATIQHDESVMQHEESQQKESEAQSGTPMNTLNALYGNTSVIIDDDTTGRELHNENLQMLSGMSTNEILVERQRLLETIDPSLVALLATRRKQKEEELKKQLPQSLHEDETSTISNEVPMDFEDSANDTLPVSNPAIGLLERSNAEQWLHFDVVERDKLAWMQDIPQQIQQLEPGAQFEARFDWKGVLLPFNSTTADAQDKQKEVTAEKDERELYLHGDEPHRPGYTLQELFRLARSHMLQQRCAAFAAIAGILNIYQQGFYDRVLELPITKIFFLLRFGLDENTLPVLEVTAKALAYLFFNDTDEWLLDVLSDNPALHWQPMLQEINDETKGNGDSDNSLSSITNLQRQMEQMRMQRHAAAAGGGTTLNANVEESETESRTSMTDFQLAETDLIDCVLRTNILQRIFYILNNLRPENSTVTSCLKILIRLARSSKQVAVEIVNNDNLMECLFKNFLPGFEAVPEPTSDTPRFYRYPQYLCLKLVRVLIAQSRSIALKLLQLQIVDNLENYLFQQNDIKTNLIRVQIEAVRVLRCLFLLRLDANHLLHRKFFPAFCCMLKWHYNHGNYDLVGGSVLIRQHAAALLAAISASRPGGGASMEAKAATNAQLGNLIYDSCCNWLHKATRVGVKEFSQATLLSGCLNVIAWSTKHCDNSEQQKRFTDLVTKYLQPFIRSPGFEEFVASLPVSSILLREATDRRLVHAALPNMGSVIMHRSGPQLVIPQVYAVPLLTALWRLIEQSSEKERKILIECLIQPRIVEPIATYLSQLAVDGRLNRYLATNFFAKAEVQLICKLICFEPFESYFTKPQMLQIVYNFLSCLTAEHICEIEQLFERVIFNKAYLCNVSAETLDKWQETCLELVHSHSIVVLPTELTLTIPYSQTPILPSDWPYFQLRHLLQNYLENVQQDPKDANFSESEILRMTFTFVEQLEQQNPNIRIATFTEKLMYLMIAFMGPESHFLDPEIQLLLRQHITRFYAQCQSYTFQFEDIYEGKCKFENLYALFVDHFQAASYGNELFGSLVLVPLAQKYNNKWRRRLWSDYAAALRFLDCNENLLLGGLNAYLEPTETDVSLLRAYAMALKSNTVRVNSIPYKIAKHHVTQFQQQQQQQRQPLQ